MDPKLAFTRILIDLDVAGGPIGLAVERWDDGQRTDLTVLEQPGPFETVGDVLARSIEYCDAFYGWMMEFPWPIGISPDQGILDASKTFPGSLEP